MVLRLFWQAEQHEKNYSVCMGNILPFFLSDTLEGRRELGATALLWYMDSQNSIKGPAYPEPRQEIQR